MDLHHPGKGGGSLNPCEDRAVEAARVAGDDGRILKPKTSMGRYGVMALIYDTENNMMGVFEAAHAARLALRRYNL